MLHCQHLLFFALHINDDLALVEHDQAVAVGDGIPHIVGDHQSGEMVLRYDFVGQFQNLCCGLGIQSGSVQI